MAEFLREGFGVGWGDFGWEGVQEVGCGSVPFVLTVHHGVNSLRQIRVVRTEGCQDLFFREAEGWGGRNRP